MPRTQTMAPAMPRGKPAELDDVVFTVSAADVGPVSFVTRFKFKACFSNILLQSNKSFRAGEMKKKVTST